MRRYELSEQKWARIVSLMPHRTHHGEAGHPFNDPRPIVNGILWVLHTGAPWRDLPERYGPWETVFKCFNRWREDGTRIRIVTSLLDELDDKKQIDHDLWCIDGSVIRASRAAAGGGKKEARFTAVGRTQGSANARAARPCARAFAGRIRHQGPLGV
jgi:transposase